ncbi:MAG: hypothetical protein N3G74_02700 [Candidatus Micrarchaeota archaeon]|nr:hypothetical protein [Candidatus Micrarchaeota archaeon]
MAIYHPGKVITIFGSKAKNVISSRKDVQALVEMWDDNLFTCDVSPAIADKLNVNDIVLVDYSPISAKISMPKQVVIKILRGETAETTWEKYRSHYSKKKSEQMPKPPQPPLQIYG